MKFLLVFMLLISGVAHADSICEAYRPLHSFQLMGFHATSSCACASCHLKGVWKGTPRTCNECHNGSRPPAIGPTTSHIPIGNTQCSECHLYTSFAGGKMNHTTVNSPPGGCALCHNGSYKSEGALGKPSGHIPTTSSCDVCHTTRSWDAKMDHAAAGITIGGGTCTSCHDGRYAKGLSNGHIPTGGVQCDVCHKSFTSFFGGTYTHTGSESCETCHNGSFTAGGAIGKPTDHPATPDNCANCHSITGWPCRTGAINTPLFDKYALKLVKWWLS